MPARTLSNIEEFKAIYALHLINILQKKDIPKEKDDWVNPDANSGDTIWMYVHLAVLNENQIPTIAKYRIHSDACISVLNHCLDRLQNDPNEKLIMAKGRDGGDSLALYTEWLDDRRARPGLYFYRED